MFSRNGDRVKQFQIHTVRVHLIEFRGQTAPTATGPRALAHLDEIVTPDFPWDQHCVVRTLPSQIIEQSHVRRRHSSKPQWLSSTTRASRKTVRSIRPGISPLLLYCRAAKVMPHQNNVFQPLLLNVRHDAADGILNVKPPDASPLDPQAQDWKPARRMTGGRVMGLCPLHADHKPTFLVDPHQKNLFY